MCCNPQPIAPAPAMMMIGVDALLALLPATSMPIPTVAAPIELTSDPRKLSVLNRRAAVTARGDDSTSFSTLKPLNHPTVPSTGPSAPRMMSALPQLVSKRSGSASAARAESAAADPLPTAAAGLAPVAAEAWETAGRSLVCCAFALTPRTRAPKKNAQKYLDFICSSLLAQIILETI